MSRKVENVETYPRPPVVEQIADPVRIELAGHTIAHSERVWRVLETFHAPTYYIPMADFADGVLVPIPGSSVCEWKGRANYFDIVAGGRQVARAAWTYPDPEAGFEPLKNHVAVYTESMDACFVGGEKVQPQPGNFYGGWVTSWITGPVKGAPGTTHW